MADAVKTVRLRDVNSGVVVSAPEETAALLAGFEPVDGEKAKAPARSRAKKSDDE